MDAKTTGHWIMYYEVQRLHREGLSYRAIAKAFAMNRRTVIKYLAMSEPAASAAQVHDWLKEHHRDFPLMSAKTVYNFVMAVRQKYAIPLEEASREYFVVEELPYGLQAQADFGQYILRNAEEKRKKVHFFVMMLSRSRMKYVHFSVSLPLTP